MNNELDPNPFDNITDEEWRRYREMEKRARAYQREQRDRLPYAPGFSLASIYAGRAGKFARPVVATRRRSESPDLREIYARRNRRSSGKR